MSQMPSTDLGCYLVLGHRGADQGGVVQAIVFPISDRASLYKRQLQMKAKTT